MCDFINACEVKRNRKAHLISEQYKKKNYITNTKLCRKKKKKNGTICIVTSIRMVLLPSLSHGEEHPMPYYETRDVLLPVVVARPWEKEDNTKLKSQTKVCGR